MGAFDMLMLTFYQVLESLILSVLTSSKYISEKWQGILDDSNGTSVQIYLSIFK